LPGAARTNPPAGFAQTVGCGGVGLPEDVGPDAGALGAELVGLEAGVVDSRPVGVTDTTPVGSGVVAKEPGGGLTAQPVSSSASATRPVRRASTGPWCHLAGNPLGGGPRRWKRQVPGP
jgi:hypothetical protein